MCEYVISSKRGRVHLKLVKDLDNQTAIASERKLEKMKLDYTIGMSLRNEDRRTMQVTITLKRKFLRGFVENIFPTGLLVIVSWVSEIHQSKVMYTFSFTPQIYASTFRQVFLFRLKPSLAE